MIKKIAVVRTDRIGDMVLTLPMCKAIKDAVPDSDLTMIASKYTEPLLLDSPVLNHYFFIEDFKRGINDIFKHNKFDIVFFPRPRFSECLTAFLARTPVRVGSGYRWYSFLMTNKVFQHRKTAEFHEAEYNVMLVESLFKKKFDVSLIQPVIKEKSLIFLNQILYSKNIELKKPRIIIHPGSGGSAYEWRALNFGLLAKKISENFEVNIIITGAGNDYEKCKIVEQQCPSAFNFYGLIELPEFIALISQSKLLIANSTGAVHIAASINIPVVGLYPNSPHLSAKRWGPYTTNRIVISPPKSDDKQKNDDMSLINFEEVYLAVYNFLSKV